MSGLWLVKLAQREQTDEEALARALCGLSLEQLGEMERAGAQEQPVHLSRFIEKVAAAQDMGRELAKLAGFPAMGALTGMAQKGLNFAAKKPGAAMAAAGAGLGAASGLLAPGRDASEQQKSRLGSALTRGAVGGALAGLASKIPTGGGGSLGQRAQGFAQQGLGRLPAAGGQSIAGFSPEAIQKLKTPKPPAGGFNAAAIPSSSLAGTVPGRGAHKPAAGMPVYQQGAPRAFPPQMAKHALGLGPLKSVKGINLKDAAARLQTALVKKAVSVPPPIIKNTTGGMVNTQAARKLMTNTVKLPGIKMASLARRMADGARLS